VWSHIPEGKHNCCGTPLEHRVKKFRTFGHAPSNKANADAGIACGIHLAREPSFFAVASSNNTKATRPTYGRGELPIGDKVHGRK
jgi:hypothetical protein